MLHVWSLFLCFSWCFVRKGCFVVVFFSRQAIRKVCKIYMHPDRRSVVGKKIGRDEQMELVNPSPARLPVLSKWRKGSGEAASTGGCRKVNI